MTEGFEAPPLASRADFSNAVRFALEQALLVGLPAMHWVDPDFTAWPFEPAVLELLARWALPHRRLVLLARQFDELPRRHPRFVAWRRTFDHVITCRAAPETDLSEMPTLLLAGAHSLQLLDRRRFRGRWLTGEPERLRWHEVIDSISQRSADAFPASTLGL